MATKNTPHNFSQSYFEAIQEFLTWISPDEFQDAMLDMLHGTIVASDEMGFDAEKLSNLLFLYRRTTELVSTIAKINKTVGKNQLSN